MAHVMPFPSPLQFSVSELHSHEYATNMVPYRKTSVYYYYSPSLFSPHHLGLVASKRDLHLAALCHSE